MKTDRQFMLDALPKHSIGAEIGVHKGNFSQRLLDNVKPTKLHLIDPWRFEKDPIYTDSLYGGPKGGDQQTQDNLFAACVQRFQREITANRIVVHRLDSVNASQHFVDGYFDWVYIDGNHQYDFVKADLLSYFPKLKVGGLLTGDDYARPSPWWGDGVEKAVIEFAATMPCHVEFIYQHQFCIRKL